MGAKTRQKRPEGLAYGISEETIVQLHVEGGQPSEGLLEAPIKTLIIFFVMRFAKLKLPFKLVFRDKLRVKHKPDYPTFSLDASVCDQFDDVVFESKAGETASDLVVLPAIFVREKRLHLTGLCSVLRFILKYNMVTTAKTMAPEGVHHHLLGYQGGCLGAPAEVSEWTRFCEVDMLNLTISFIGEAEKCEHTDSGPREKALPKEFEDLEAHLGKPIKIHNIRKRMQKDVKQVDSGGPEDSRSLNLTEGHIKLVGGQEKAFDEEQGQDVDPIQIFAKTQHIFVEGPDLLLSDILIFLNFHLLLESSVLDGHDVEKLMPRTWKWLMKMEESGAPDVAQAMNLSLVCQSPERQRLKLVEPLRSRPPSAKLRDRNPKSRAFTRQVEVERVFDWFHQSGGMDLVFANEGAAFPTHSEVQAAELNFVTWDKVPSQVHPLGGSLPEKRLMKKCQQLEGMAKAVVDIVQGNPRWNLDQTGPKIVDFCSGGGHLGILLAYLLPRATIVLVENKEESLRRAWERIDSLGLTNCHLFQCNLDYFLGAFDIGVSLHACGVATDLVLKACLDRQASFVVCPCCYGSVRENHILGYPKSQAFQRLHWSFEDFLVVGHTADQTHVTNEKHEQGQQAMDIVDSDRAHEAVEAGYAVRVTKLQPPSCTPKNNVIIGIAPSRL